MEKLTVLGAGSWGTSIANLLGNNGHRVNLWCFEEETAEEIAKSKENSIYLPEIKLSENIMPTSSLEEACTNTKRIISVVPSQFTRSVIKKANNFIPDECLFVSASKGIEKKFEIFRSVCGHTRHRVMRLHFIGMQRDRVRISHEDEGKHNEQKTSLTQ